MKRIAVSTLIASAIVLTACSTTSTPNSESKINTTAPLADKVWIVTHINGQAISTKPTDHNIPSLLLDSSKLSFSGADGCNRIMGSYTATQTELKFGQTASTMMACLDDNIQKVSSSYTQALPKVERYQVTPTTLILKDKDGNTVIQFTTAVQPR